MASNGTWARVWKLELQVRFVEIWQLVILRVRGTVIIRSHFWRCVMSLIFHHPPTSTPLLLLLLLLLSLSLSLLACTLQNVVSSTILRDTCAEGKACCHCLHGWAWSRGHSACTPRLCQACSSDAGMLLLFIAPVWYFCYSYYQCWRVVSIKKTVGENRTDRTLAWVIRTKQRKRNCLQIRGSSPWSALIQKPLTRSSPGTNVCSFLSLFVIFISSLLTGKWVPCSVTKEAKELCYVVQNLQ